VFGAEEVVENLIGPKKMRNNFGNGFLVKIKKIPSSSPTLCTPISVTKMNFRSVKRDPGIIAKKN
jgi:hypothetical protein